MPAKNPRAKRVVATSEVDNLVPTASAVLASLKEQDRLFDIKVREIKDSLRSRPRCTTLVRIENTPLFMKWLCDGGKSMSEEDIRVLESFNHIEVRSFYITAKYESNITHYIRPGDSISFHPDNEPTYVRDRVDPPSRSMIEQGRG